MSSVFRSRHDLRSEFYSIGIFMLVIWLVFIVDSVIPATLTDWGLRPRTLVGLIGIPLMPLLHDGFTHVLGNTLSLAILLGLLAGSRAGGGAVTCWIVIISGSLLWVFGRAATHVGASGLVFGLSAFLIVSGILEKRLIPLTISIVVAVMYGGTLLSGVLPRWGGEVSWDGHLCGAVAGVVVAYGSTTYARSERAFFRR